MGIRVRVIYSVDLRRGVSDLVRRIVDDAEVLRPTEPLDETFPFLRSLDPYGLTYFARTQMPGLREEIAKLAGSIDEGIGKAFLAELDALAVECAQNPHWFLVFCGE